MKTFFFVLTLTLAAVYPLKAETIQGEVKSIQPDGSSFAMKPVQEDASASAQDMKEMSVKVGPKTKYEGLSSVQELTAGDEVSVDGKKKDQNLEADLIKISKVKIHEPIKELKDAGASKKGS